MDEGKEKERRMEEVQEQMTAKRILYRKKDSSWFGSDYNVNLYQGCPHGCIYCDSRSECYGVEHFSQVRAKRDALDLLQKQLASCRKGGMVATGSMSDPYNPLEEKQRLTRGMLTLLLRYSFGVSIATKSSLVERDIDLLEQIKGYAPALVKLTITTPHDRLAEQLEPHAPSSSRRLQTLERLRARGIFAGVLLMPVLPFLEDNPKDIRLLVERCAQAGAKFIYPYFGVTLRDRQREYFLECLEKADQMFGKNIWCWVSSMTTAARMKKSCGRCFVRNAKSTASCGGWSRSSQLLKSRIKTNSFAFFGSKTGRTHPMRPPCFFQNR